MAVVRSVWLAAVYFCVVAGEVGWDEPNIILEGNPQHWAKVPEPKPGDPKPFPPLDDRWKSKKATVVVLIAALRETRCGETLKNLFSKAEHPSRVYMAVVQQNSAEDEDCVAAYCRLIGAPDASENCRFSSHVRMRRMKASEAQGPVFARAQQKALVKESDDFCMQVDAHTDAVQDWDTLMLQQWGMTNNEYAVITTYPTNAKADLGKNSNNHWEMPHICQASLGYRGQISNHQASAAANLVKPIFAPLWAAGLSFSRCHAELRVPNDPLLKGIFSGEEYSRGARLWTHGYDFYSPTRPWIGTYYGGDKHGKGSWHTKSQDLQYAQERLMTLLRWPKSDQSKAAYAKMEGFQLGKRRSLEAYAKFSGIDTMHGTAFPKQCGKLFVPWENADDVYIETARKSAPKIKADSFGLSEHSQPSAVQAHATHVYVPKPPSGKKPRSSAASSSWFSAQILLATLAMIGALLCCAFRVLKMRKKQALP